MFSQSNNEYRVVNSGINIVDELPKGIYNVTRDQFGNFILTRSTTDYTIPSKVYGDVHDRASRILQTWENRQGRNTGVLLSGDKGSGKSLLAKIAAARFIQEKNGIVLVVAQPYHGTAFDQLLSSIEQPCAIFMDEFEKTYDKDDQERVLSIMDGALTKNKLFIVTVNDIWRVDTNIVNRPGRMYYHYKYNGLAMDFVREYCEDKLKNKGHVRSICQTANIFEKFNFDMLQAIVEELNRYENDSITDVLDRLNVQPSLYRQRDDTQFSVKIMDGNVDITSFYHPVTTTSPLTNRDHVRFGIKEEFEDTHEKYKEDFYAYLSEKDLIKISEDGQSMTFKDSIHGFEYVLTKMPKPSYGALSLVR